MAAKSIRGFGGSGRRGFGFGNKLLLESFAGPYIFPPSFVVPMNFQPGGVSPHRLQISSSTSAARLQLWSFPQTSHGVDLLTLFQVCLALVVMRHRHSSRPRPPARKHERLMGSVSVACNLAAACYFSCN
jgi:hypothetical protein